MNPLNLNATGQLAGNKGIAAFSGSRPAAQKDAADLPKDRLTSQKPEDLKLIKPMYPLVGGRIEETELKDRLADIPKWNLKMVDGMPRIEREIKFDDFASAMSFSNKVAEFADVQGHHPTLLTEWGKVTIGWWTHDVGGLHANDFTSARRTDALLGER